ncbi:toll/interleukin-1 receptor domain-containing protein [Streptacidiphilus anmyonensis]|uniref:toll/interleukin-1 receptor domain-containing protein n=1 Tax=Streptacidiphilus anmyonensis TaxID=405782 RepID=UPI0005A8B05C|nr:toll/interleukin-1 receptor domain-containing protein [Streptacidiphilus anmyonensis]
MPDVFINYRTGDGDKTATLIERELSHRFGSERIFRASKSIRPGARYPRELLDNIRRSAVLLAVIGESWFDSGSLHDESDWVRREILTALEYGIPVIPVLEGRRTERLRVADFPPELREIAESQSLRLDLNDAETGLRRIGDELVALVSALRQADTAARPDTDPVPGSVHNSVDNLRGTSVQTRDISGDVGTVVKGNHGPVHTGRGDIHERHYHGNHNEFSGDGATYVQGDVRGTIRNDFSGPRRRRDGGR